MEKLKVLPQTFYKFQCNKDLVNKILELVKKEKCVRMDANSPYANSRSSNTTLHKEPEYNELTNWFYNCIDEVRKDLQLQCEKFTITQCWSNVSAYGKSHHQHLHPNSFLSAVFYLNNSNAKTWFCGKNIWHYFDSQDKVIQVAPETDCELNLIHKEKTEEGKLLIFPSSVMHLVEPNNTSDSIVVSNRYTMSFNAFPSGKIGRMNFLTGLDIEIK